MATDDDDPTHDRADALSTASALVAERCPTAVLAVVAGSVARGEGTATSDLDVVVVADGDPVPYRETLRAGRWLVELFVHTPRSLRFFFEQERSQGRGTLAHMLAEGTVLVGSQAAAAVVDDARAEVDLGPPPLDPAELDRRRYLLTDALDDLVGASEPDERDIVAGQVTSAAADLVLRGRGQWAGSGKWLYRRLKDSDPLLAPRLMAAHRAVIVSGDVAQLVAVVEEVLAEHGGRLDVGYIVRGIPKAAS